MLQSYDDFNMTMLLQLGVYYLEEQWLRKYNDERMISDTYSVFLGGMELHLERLVDRVSMDLGNRKYYTRNNQIILTLLSRLTGS